MRLGTKKRDSDAARAGGYHVTGPEQPEAEAQVRRRMTAKVQVPGRQIRAQAAAPGRRLSSSRSMQ